VGGQYSPDSEDHNYRCGGMTLDCAELTPVCLTAKVFHSENDRSHQRRKRQKKSSSLIAGVEN